jgi:hypothetical protein
VLFGDPNEFAIEAVLEPGPEYPAVQGTSLFGRMCVWMRGRSVGRFDEPCCGLGAPARSFVEVDTALGTLWDDRFEALAPDEIFDWLDAHCFAAYRHTTLPFDEWPDDPPPSLWRFSILINWSEAFDGWKVFLLQPSKERLMALVLTRDAEHVEVYEFSTGAFRSAVRAFARWLDDQEDALLPELDRGKYPRLDHLW